MTPAAGSHREASSPEPDRTSRVTRVPVRAQVVSQRRAEESRRATDDDLHLGQDPSSSSNVAALQASLDRSQEAAGVGTVDESVVVGQREVGHAADRDALAD